MYNLVAVGFVIMVFVIFISARAGELREIGMSYRLGVKETSMNEMEMLALGEALARTVDVLRPGEQVRMPARTRSRPVRASVTSVVID